MITLIRDGITMEVATELQASVFLRSGYRRVENKAGAADVAADPTKESAAEKPKKRTRRAKIAE